jgi:mannosyltransferase
LIERPKRQIAWTAILSRSRFRSDDFSRPGTRATQVATTSPIPGLRILLLVITLLALALRLYRLGAQSLWYDEGVSVYLARMSLPQLTAWTADDIQPPLYYYLLHFWLLLFGQSSSEFVVRFPSLFFGVLTVPLMYRIGRHLFGTTAGLLAAFLTAVSPLYLWYAQETRMYTMLTFLCLLSSYLLLKALERRAPPHLPIWLAFAVANVAAAYTHYFAFFVMAFQGIYLVAWSWWMRRRERRSLLRGLVALAAVALAYLPWVPFMLYRYQADVSYWQGTLKLNEVLRKALISFSLGETVIEEVGAKLAVGYGVIALIALAAIALSKRDTDHKTHGTLHPPFSILFLLLYLLLPIALIIALSYRIPKFSPRYLMLSSPAFFLIIAGGLATLLRWGEKGKGPSALRHLPPDIWHLLSAICLLFILTTSAYADYNNYFNIHFTKADFRGAARRIEEDIGPDETVILTSGHMYPVLTYYYSSHNWHPIPAEQTLSTEHTLNFSVAADLNRALEGKSGVWVVLWQDEVVDPNGFLLMMLEEKGELLQAEDLWHVRLRHFALPEGVHFSSQPDIQHPTEINFEGQIKLLGYDSRFTIDDSRVTIYWQAEQQLDDDYKVSLRLRDEEGHYWGRLDRRPTAYLYPTTRWKVGELLFGRYGLPMLPGTPPGEYQLEVVLYSEARPEGLEVVGADGVARGASAVIGTMSVPKAEQPPSKEELGINQPLEAAFDGRIALLGYELGQSAVQPGDSLYLMLFWQALADVGEDYSLTIALVDQDRKVVGEETFSPLVRAYPTSRWVAGEVWRGQYNFRVPIEAQPGQARLQIGLVDESGQPLGESVSLVSLEVQATDRVFTAPETQYPSRANFGDLVTLVGADLGTATAGPGETLHLTLYWQAQTTMNKSYTVFIHLLDSDSRIWAQQDGIPVSGARPTTGWVPGEVIRDEVQLAVDLQAPPGDYVIEVGLYDAGDPALPRLPVLSIVEGEVEGPVLDEAGHPIDDRVLLAEVRVE